MQSYVVTTHEQLAEVAAAYAAAPAFCYDVETVGDFRVDPRRNRVTWISLAAQGRCDVIPLGHPHGDLIRTDYPLKLSGLTRQARGLELREADYSTDVRKATQVWHPAPVQLGVAEVFAALEPAMFGPGLKVGHNLKFDLSSVAKYYGGQVPSPPYADTMVAAYLHDSGARPAVGYPRPYALDAVLKRYLDVEMQKGVGKEVEVHAFTDVARYSYRDAKWTWLLWLHLKSRLDRDRLAKLMGLEMDVLEVLCDMESAGAIIDHAELVRLEKQFAVYVDTARGKVYAAAGRAFNIESPAQKIELLYGPKPEGRGLRPRKFTRGEQPSTAADALEAFRGRDALVDSLLEYADVKKLHGTYLKAYLLGTTKQGKQLPPLAVRGRDGLHRIHADFSQIGAETGRFSCREPNLQNVPAPHTEHGRAIRGLFVASPGEKLVVADYSQIEPRVIAALANDPTMKKAYQDGEDLYLTVAGEMGVDRKAGKVLVLSIAYGIGPDNVALDLGCSVTRAKKLMADFDARFTSIDRYRKQVIRESKQRRPPQVRTLLGRRRYLPDLFSSEYKFRARAERQAFNTKIQGTAADIIKLAMVRCARRLPEQARLFLTVHDELVITTPASLAELTAAAVREAMEGITLLSVPLVADVKIVDRWSQAK